jgi:hypothetical protein
MIFTSLLNLCFAQIPDPNTKTEISLADGTRVVLFKSMTREADFHPYYYFPVNLRISIRGNLPEFSFLSYDNDGDGRIDGAIMHMLLTWGLTRAQKKVVEAELKSKKGRSAFLAGAFPLLPDDQDFRIISDSEIGEIIKKSLKSRGGIALAPGEKMALSFMFSAEDPLIMEDALRNTRKLDRVFFEMLFNFPGSKEKTSIILRGSFRGWIEEINKEKIR